MPSYKLTFMILFMSDITVFALFGCRLHITIDRVEGIDPGNSSRTRPMVWFLDYVRLIIHRTREETEYVESNDE